MSNGTFGAGGNNVTTDWGSGGGAGYYGGGAGNYNSGIVGSGAGGSSFVSGHAGCDAIDITGTATGQATHYSGKVFIDTDIIAGNAQFLSPTGEQITGNTGNGYARITLYELSGLSMELNGDASIMHMVGDPYIDQGAVAHDDIDGDITANIIVTSDVNINTAGIYTVTYEITNSLGETIIMTRTIDMRPNAYEYDYTGAYQMFEAPRDGLYEVELWGAQGGASRYNSNNTGDVIDGGTGGYTRGNVYLTQGEKLYIYVGQKGFDAFAPSSATAGGYNGGGKGAAGYQNGGGGGGATDVRYFGASTPVTTQLVWNEAVSLRSRVMIAAGGAGTSNYSNAIAGGVGGGLTGLPGQLNPGSAAHVLAGGGTQTAGGTAGQTASPGTFGIGGASQAGHGGGGGAGFYGGGGGGIISGGVSSGAGGSSFISGYSGCIALAGAGANTARTDINPIDKATHYSGLIFENSLMLSGNIQTVDPRTGYGTTRKCWKWLCEN